MSRNSTSAKNFGSPLMGDHDFTIVRATTCSIPAATIRSGKTTLSWHVPAPLGTPLRGDNEEMDFRVAPFRPALLPHSQEILAPIVENIPA